MTLQPKLDAARWTAPVSFKVCQRFTYGFHAISGWESHDQRRVIKALCVGRRKH